MPNKATKASSLALAAALVILTTAFTALPVSSSASLNNVQVFTATPSRAYSFEFAAYNLSGFLVASTQTSYSAAAFELPAGGYLFTVSATDFGRSYGVACPLRTGTGVAGQGQTPSIGSNPPPVAPNSSEALIPWCYPPSSEYGYATATVSGAQTVDIKMQNVTTLPTTPVTVKVSYANGTAASDASVYASIIGEWYFWWGQDSPITTSAQTDGNGVAHLVLPVAPAVVTSWKWLPVLTGANGSTVQTTVGGEKVNATLHWEPTYFGLSGSGLLLPPADSMAITLRYQRPDYWVLPGGVASASAGTSGTTASQPGGVPSLASPNSATSSGPYLPTQIPSVQQAEAIDSVNQQAGFPGIDALAYAGVALLATVLAVVLVAARYRAHRPPPSAG